MLPAILLILVFAYFPMYGLIISFQDYIPGRPMLGEGVEWVGLKWFIKFITGPYFVRLMKNTLILSGLYIVFGIGSSILFALLIDQIRHTRFKKLVQTASYMPYFISAVVVSGMVITFVDAGGLITNILSMIGLPNENYHMKASAFPWIYVFTYVWMTFGFESILYCSTISSIDPGLYESARIDGANRWQQVWHVTLPGLRGVIAIKIIMAIGSVLVTNSELIMLLYTPATYETADVIGTYVYRLGILDGQYSYTTAVGLFMSVVGFTLTYLANKISNKLTGLGLW